MRKAAEAVDAASRQSVEEIVANLRNVETELARIIEDENKVKVIVKELLEREVALKKLLEELYQQQQEEQSRKSKAKELEVTGQKSSTVSAQAKSVRPRQGAAPGPVVEKEPAEPTKPEQGKEAGKPRDSPPPARNSPRSRKMAVTAARSQASASRQGSRAGNISRGSGGVGSSHVGSSTVDPGLLLAMAIGGSEDGLLTRDATTMEEFILLMSAEALAEEAEDSPPLNERWRQPELSLSGLSLTGALDRASARFGRPPPPPPRPPNLLSLASRVRPPRSWSRGAPGIVAGKRKAHGMPPTSTNTPVGEGASAVSARETSGSSSTSMMGAIERKRRRADPNAIMCPFELSGVCNDDDCRYQHVDAYLPVAASGNPSADGASKASTKASSEPSGKTGTERAQASAAATAAPAAGSQDAAASTQEKNKQRERHLPDIQFGEQEAQGGGVKGQGTRGPKRPRPSGEEGEGGAERAAAPPRSATQAATDTTPAARSPAHETSDSGQRDSGAEEGEVREAGANASEKADRGDTAPSRQSPDPVTDGINIADLADSFSRAASGTLAAENQRSRRGRSGGRRDERYYEEVELDSSPPATVALTKSQLAGLGKRLAEIPCDVEGWILLSMHLLPRAGDSATAALNTVKVLARSGKGTGGAPGDVTLKPALRALVRGLETSEQGKAEELWLMYLTLFSRLPVVGYDALGMAQDALDNFPSSRKMWRLYRAISQARRQSLSDEVALYRDRLRELVQIHARATANKSQASGGDAQGAAAIGSEHEGKSSAGALSPRQSADLDPTPSGLDPSTEELEGMTVYLVLERCSALAEGGYTFQAALEVLDALDEKTALHPWRADGGGSGSSVLRMPPPSRPDGNKPGTGDGGTSSSTASTDLPEGISAALRETSPDGRCLLWLTALHLLVMGNFPSHVLDLAETLGKTRAEEVAWSASSDCSRGRCLELLRWPEESLSPDSPAGRRLAASDELRDATTRTFMSALKDARLLPSERRGGRWAPPLRVHDALIPSASEAAGARAGGMAPDPTALQGPGLVLSLNWLTFCCRGGKGKEEEVRTVALACCRRFQLARPDHPALLAHNLVEHHASEARPLDGIYREISTAFDEGGAAAEAVLERGGRVSPDEASREGLVPSAGRLEAVYAFLCFVAAREAEGVVEGGPEASGPSGGEAEATRAVLREALIGLWVRPSEPTLPGRSTGTTDRSSREGDSDVVRLAVERAKASLFRWADGGNHRSTPEDRGRLPAAGSAGPGHDDDAGAGRQLAVIFFALWILAGPTAASGALDHLLSADSFSGMSPVLRRLSWLHRLEAAVVLSESEAGVQDPTHGVREVALRALADQRARPRPRYSTLARYVASTLDSGGNEGLSSSEGAIFVRDILRTYGEHFRSRRGGVDWVIVAEALGSPEDTRSESGGRSNPTASAELASCCVLELLHWVNGANELPGSGPDTPPLRPPPSVNEGTATLALRQNARPYAKRALDVFPEDAGLAGVVAALEVATGDPGSSQRTLEAALRKRPKSCALWEQRIALEAAYGVGSKERAGKTAKAAASTGVLLRLRCVSQGRMAMSRALPLTRVERRASRRILAAISNPSLRPMTKSLALQAALSVAPSNGPIPARRPGGHYPSPEVPRSVFLLTNLVSLSLAGNGLTALPSALGRLSSLRSLDASGNALTGLPSSMCRLSGSLRILRLAENRLASPLPVSPVGRLANLRLLDLEGNNLDRFPTVVLRLTELRTLKLARNKFLPRAPSGLSDALRHLEDLTLPDAPVERPTPTAGGGGDARAGSPGVVSS